MWYNRLVFIETLFLYKECYSSNVALLPSETGDLITGLDILLCFSLLLLALESDSESKKLLDESELSELLISPLLLLPTVELELEELSLVPTTPDVDAGIAKTSKGWFPLVPQANIRRVPTISM
jgi:hypothetical protein